MKEEKDFIEWYKNKVSENLEEPPPHVWEKIADDLDTNDVWDRIAADLDARSGWLPQKWRYASLAIMILLFVTGGSYYFFSNNNADTSQVITGMSDTVVKDEYAPQKEKDKQKQDRSGENDASTVPSNNAPKAQTHEMPTGIHGTANGTPAKDFKSAERNSNASIASHHSDRAKLRSLELSDSMLLVSIEQLRLAKVPGTSTVPPDEEPQAFRKTLLLGITASAKNTWLLNRQTLSGLEKKTLHTTKPDFGKDLGVVIAYDFSPKFALQAEGNFLSDMGQRYNEYRNGKYVDRNIDLVYYNANLMIKYSPRKYTYGLRRNAHAITGGLFYSLLKNSLERINDRPARVDDNYTSDDYGAIIGYEYNRYLGERFEFTTGLRVNIGLRDIGTEPWFRTTSGSLGLNVAIKYRLHLD